MKRTVTVVLTLLLLTATLVATPGTASAASPPTPTIVRADHNGTYTNLVWRNLPSVKGVNVYRNGSFRASVNMPGNVYNDFSGKVGDVYYITAYDHSGNISSKSNRVRANFSTLQPVKNLKAKHVGDGRVDLTWDRSSESIGGWRVYRNGEYMKDRKASGRRIMVDYNSAADQISYYEVQPYSWDIYGKLIWGPKSPVGSPILESLQRNHPQPVTVTGTGGQSDQKAEAANAATAAALREREEATTAFGLNAAALATFAVVPMAGKPAAAVAVIATGFNAWRQLEQAKHAYEVAKQKMKEFNQCMSSSSCNGSGGGGGGGDTLAPGDYHDATLDQIPGQPTQVSAD